MSNVGGGSLRRVGPRKRARVWVQQEAVMRNSLELGNHSANPEQTQALKVTMETGAHRGIQGVGWVGGRMDRWAMDG